MKILFNYYGVDLSKYFKSQKNNLRWFRGDGKIESQIKQTKTAFCNVEK